MLQCGKKTYHQQRTSSAVSLRTSNLATVIELPKPTRSQPTFFTKLQTGIPKPRYVRQTLSPKEDGASDRVHVMRYGQFDR